MNNVPGSWLFFSFSNWHKSSTWRLVWLGWGSHFKVIPFACPLLSPRNLEVLFTGVYIFLSGKTQEQFFFVWRQKGQTHVRMAFLNPIWWGDILIAVINIRVSWVLKSCGQNEILAKVSSTTPPLLIHLESGRCADENIGGDIVKMWKIKLEHPSPPQKNISYIYDTVMSQDSWQSRGLRLKFNICQFLPHGILVDKFGCPSTVWQRVLIDGTQLE